MPPTRLVPRGPVHTTWKTARSDRLPCMLRNNSRWSPGQDTFVRGSEPNGCHGHNSTLMAPPQNPVAESKHKNAMAESLNQNRVERAGLFEIDSVVASHDLVPQGNTEPTIFPWTRQRKTDAACRLKKALEHKEQVIQTRIQTMRHR
jgi:hypothetical protein